MKILNRIGFLIYALAVSYPVIYIFCMVSYELDKFLRGFVEIYTRSTGTFFYFLGASVILFAGLILMSFSLKKTKWYLKILIILFNLFSFISPMVIPYIADVITGFSYLDAEYVIMANLSCGVCLVLIALAVITVLLTMVDVNISKKQPQKEKL